MIILLALFVVAYLASSAYMCGVLNCKYPPVPCRTLSDYYNQRWVDQPPIRFFCWPLVFLYAAGGRYAIAKN